MLKQISILVVTTVMSFAFWLLVKPWIRNINKFGDIELWILPLVVLVLLASAISLAYIVLPKKRTMLLLSGLVALSYLLVLGFHWLNIIGFILIIAFHAIAIHHVSTEIKSRVKLEINRSVRHGIGYIILPILLAVSFGYYLTPAVQSKTRVNEIQPTLTEVVGKTLDALLKNEGSTAYQKEVAKTAAYEKFYHLYDDWVTPYRQYFPPVLAFGLFVALWGLTFVLIPIAVWTTHLIFAILRATGYVIVEEMDVKAERIHI